MKFSQFLSVMVFLIAGNIFAQDFPIDTTLKADLNFDGRQDIILVKFERIDEDGSGIIFTLSINGKSTTGILPYADGCDVSIIDVNSKDKNLEVAVGGYGIGEFNNYCIYKYLNVPYFIMRTIGISYIETKGDGYLISYEWMGFWSLERKYYLTDNGAYLEEIIEESVPLNIEGKVVQPFNIYQSREEGAPKSYEFKEREKFTIIAADPRVARYDEGGYVDDYSFVWYKIKSSNGTTGWARLNTFSEKVDGLPWAG